MRKLKVYLAAPYRQKDTIRVFAEELRARDIVVTSSWLEEPHRSTIQIQDLTAQEHQKYAVNDVKDVAAADILVMWTDPTRALIRQGRHVELGMAVGIGLTRAFPIFIVGDENENIFHYLPQITRFSTWDEARQKLFELGSIA